jgi:hypothetical protein
VIRKLEPILFCHYCRAPLLRRRHPNGRLEKLVDFRRRKYCDQACYRLNRYREAS